MTPRTPEPPDQLFALFKGAQWLPPKQAEGTSMLTARQSLASDVKAVRVTWHHAPKKLLRREFLWAPENLQAGLSCQTERGQLSLTLAVWLRLNKSKELSMTLEF